MLKTTCILITTLFFTSIGQSQDLAVPMSVTRSFSEIFPDISDVSWKLEEDSKWVAQFSKAKDMYYALFSDDGTWKETKHVVKQKSVPKPVNSAVKRDYQKGKVVEVNFSEKPIGNFYIYLINIGNKEEYALYDDSGKLLRKGDTKY